MKGVGRKGCRLGKEGGGEIRSYSEHLARPLVKRKWLSERLGAMTGLSPYRPDNNLLATKGNDKRSRAMLLAASWSHTNTGYLESVRSR